MADTDRPAAVLFTKACSVGQTDSYLLSDSSLLLFLSVSQSAARPHLKIEAHCVGCERVVCLFYQRIKQASNIFAAHPPPPAAHTCTTTPTLIQL